MPGLSARGFLAAPAIAALFAITGCGGSDGGDGGIPPDTAESMLALTGEIETAALPEDCDTAQSTTTELRNQVDSLDQGETREALSAMVTRLDQNLDEDCAAGTSPDAETEEPPPEEETAPVETTPTETAPTETEPVEPPPEEETEEPATPEQPPGEGGGPDGPPQTPPGQGGGPPTGGLEEE